MQVTCHRVARGKPNSLTNQCRPNTFSFNKRPFPPSAARLSPFANVFRNQLHFLKTRISSFWSGYERLCTHQVALISATPEGANGIHSHSRDRAEDSTETLPFLRGHRTLSLPLPQSPLRLGAQTLQAHGWRRLMVSSDLQEQGQQLEGGPGGGAGGQGQAGAAGQPPAGDTPKSGFDENLLAWPRPGEGISERGNGATKTRRPTALLADSGGLGGGAREATELDTL